MIGGGLLGLAFVAAGTLIILSGSTRLLAQDNSDASLRKMSAHALANPVETAIERLLAEGRKITA